MAHKIRITMLRDLPTYVDPKHRNAPDVYMLDETFEFPANAVPLVDSLFRSSVARVNHTTFVPTARIAKVDIVEVTV